MSAVIESTRAREFSAAFAAFVFAESEDMLNTVSVRCGRIPILAVNESGSRIYNNDVLFCKDDSPEEFILRYLKETYDILPDTYYRYDFVVDGDYVQCESEIIKLTSVELDILRLAIMCREKWITADNIEAVCFGGKSKGERVAVHICNLNKKFRIATGRRAILSKRGVGYTLSHHL